eukprot:TRINITY_DN1678_c0_g2_i10.p1 TRINITY_DN1678_c0_g2~~TRINITY_DN1678_c0_g2_i10.p1  ORF type:complete len:368 (-),score=75.04 TRINITY_DN1678_c0_g2_i10:20-1123(-)
MLSEELQQQKITALEQDQKLKKIITLEQEANREVQTLRKQALALVETQKKLTEELQSKDTQIRDLNMRLVEMIQQHHTTTTQSTIELLSSKSQQKPSPTSPKSPAFPNSLDRLKNASTSEEIKQVSIPCRELLKLVTEFDSRGCSCAQTIQQNASTLGLEDIHDAIAACNLQVQELQNLESVKIFKFSSDQLLSIVLYTYNNGSLHPERNLFYILNKDLRERTLPRRIYSWLGYLHFLSSAISRLPAERCTVYRGVAFQTEREKNDIQHKYTTHRLICWSAFSSTTKSPVVAVGFATSGAISGVVFKMEVISGRNVKQLSQFPDEEELLLGPNTRFVVQKEMSYNHSIKCCEILLFEVNTGEPPFWV